jgi:hypothetical protein
MELEQNDVVDDDIRISKSKLSSASVPVKVNKQSKLK